MIPERIITKPPTAELRADQKDEDSLPPYAVLDGILEGLVEQDSSPRELVAAGLRARDGPRRSRNLLDLAEYKRRQAPPGVKITAQGLRPRPALPDHQRLPADRAGRAASDGEAAAGWGLAHKPEFLRGECVR